MESWITVHLQQPHLLGAHEDTISPKTCTLIHFNADHRSDIHQRVTHLEVLVDHEVAANQVEEAQTAVQLGLDCKETLRHDLLHALLSHGREETSSQSIHRSIGFNNIALPPAAIFGGKQLPSYISSSHGAMFLFIWRHVAT